MDDMDVYASFNISSVLTTVYEEHFKYIFSLLQSKVTALYANTYKKYLLFPELMADKTARIDARP